MSLEDLYYKRIDRKQTILSHNVLSLGAKLILMNICQLVDFLCNGQRV